MSACCRRLTSPTTALHHIPPRTTNCLQLSHRKFLHPSSPFEVLLRSKPLVIQASSAGRHDDFEEKQPRCSSLDRDAAPKVNSGGVERRTEVVVAAAATVVLGVGNRVLYKLALVPLKRYPFFLAQLATFGYVIVYFSILYLRYQSGKVTDEMLSLPKTPLIAVGLLEALAAAAGKASAAVLPGATIPILSQSFLVWQLGLSYIFLKRKYRFNQLFGCFLVAAGVVVTVASGAGTGSLMKTGLFWSTIMILSFFLQAVDTVLKEAIFLDAAQRLKGGVDLFVVNSFGSAYQAVFICLLLPFLSNLWGIPFNQLPSYLKDGAACFLNIDSMSNGCDGAPLLPLLFVVVNMGYNISLLHLLKISSAVVSCLASTLSASFSSSSSSKAGKEILVQHLLVKEDDQKCCLIYKKELLKVPEFEEAAFNAPLNKVVSCKTKSRWHLLQVLSERAIASLPGFKVFPLCQFGSWGPEIMTKFDRQKETYVIVNVSSWYAVIASCPMVADTGFPESISRDGRNS